MKITSENLTDKLNSFIDWREKQHKTIRGGQVMYDVKGCHKYLYENELFDYYMSM